MLQSKKFQKKKHEYFSIQRDGCFLCERKGFNFEFWKIVENIFPYDKIAASHDMLTTIRHVAKETELSTEEKTELLWIKTQYLPDSKYDLIIENLPKKQSAPSHYHIHLIILKQ